MGLIVVLALTLAVTVDTRAVLDNQQILKLGHTLRDPTVMSALCHCLETRFMKL